MRRTYAESWAFQLHHRQIACGNGTRLGNPVRLNRHRNRRFRRT